MAEYTNWNASWIGSISKEQLEDPDFIRIFVFFVLHSPCYGLSAMVRPLYSYGWRNPWRKPYCLNRRLKKASSNPKLLYAANNYDRLGEALKKSGLNDDFPCHLSQERIAFYDNMGNQFMSVFYHIRNAIAHGRIGVFNLENVPTYVFEDGVVNKKTMQIKLSARMVIRKETILKWIDIIENDADKPC